MERKYVGMTQVSYDVYLAQKSFRTQLISEIFAQDLDGDLAIVFEVVRQIYGSHATATKCALDLVAFGERRDEPFWNICHLVNPSHPGQES